MDEADTSHGRAGATEVHDWQSQGFRCFIGTSRIVERDDGDDIEVPPPDLETRMAASPYGRDGHRLSEVSP